MPAEIADEVAHFGSDGGILVNDEILQIVVNICIMNVFVEVF